MADIRRRRVGQPLFILFVRSGLAELARHGFLPLFAMGSIPPAERLNMIPSFAPPFFQIHKSHGIGYGMNSVGTAAVKKLGVICDGRAKRGLSGSGGLCPFLWEQPSADPVNNTVSVPLSFDVNRYFKPLWKPSHLLDTNLKSCGNCLRPTTQIFLRAKPTRAFMNNQEPDLNQTPAETDSAKTNESVQRERSELPVDQRSSYLRSRQIALKKFSPQGGDPS